MRPLTALERNVADAIRDFAAVRPWEFSAAVQDGTDLLYFGTSMSPSESPMPPIVDRRAADGAAITILHNHRSNESLSWADWYGLAEASYRETFAFGAKGATYWGRVIDQDPVVAAHGQQAAIDEAAHQALALLFRDFPNRQVSEWAPSFFTKHVVAEALKSKGYVEYQADFAPGSSSDPWSAAIVVAVPFIGAIDATAEAIA